VPWAQEVCNLFPNAKELQLKGERYLTLPHQPTEAYLLRKLGFDVPAPILSHYDWAGGTPFDVQRKTCAMMSMYPRSYVFNGMGTGKTKAALWNWDYLRGNKLCGKLLVAAPLSTLSFTWAREVFNTLPGVKYAVLHGTKQRRLERLHDPEIEIFIINHDGIEVIEKELNALVASKTIDALVIDELAVYRNGGAARTKKMRKLAATMNWVWGMTGEPIPNQPTDLWAQCSIVTPHTVPKYFGRFRDDLMIKKGPFLFVPKDDAVERAFAAAQPSVRFSLDDVVELPECVERMVDIPLGVQQAKIYKLMADQCYAAIQTHEITAANAGAAMNKLLQIACGWVYTKDRGIVALDGDARLDALIDAINASDRKVLVFAPYKHVLAGISKRLTAEGIEHEPIDGDTPASRRNELFNIFQNTSKFKVLPAHPKCLAHGITLTSADTNIWFGPITDLDTFDQANHRIIRVGQKHKQLILGFQGSPVERKIYTLLRSKQRVQNKLLELFEEASRI